MFGNSKKYINFISNFNIESAAVVKNHDAKCTEFTPMQNANFKNNMQYISATLCFSTRAIEHSETKNVSSTEILKVVEKYADKLENTRRHEKSCFMICYCN